MKLNPQLKNASPLALGFTLAEVLLASALTMVLMFGALYGTSESYEVARSGDRRVHTHISARRALDRLLKDCRYADDVALGGNPQSGYSITIDATSELDPEILTYFWSPSTKEVTVTDGATTDLVLSGVQTVIVDFDTTEVEGVTEVSRLGLEWTVAVTNGLEAGLPQDPGMSITIAGSTWIRRFAEAGG